MEKCLDRLKMYLEEHEVKYEVQHHKETYTAQEVAAEVHEKGRFIAKVFIARADGNLKMLVLPAHLHVDYERIKQYTGAEDFRREHEDHFKHLFPDCEVGAMPPFGNLYKIPVYLDRSLAEMPYLVFQAGSHRDTIKIATHDYIKLVNPTIARFALEPEPAEPAEYAA
jgi:Ala-tRNA(Pro) deacylase